MIPGIVLAAGASTRMGRPKALLPTDVPGETFVTRLVATLRSAGVDEVVVVVGAHADAIRLALERMPQPPRIVENANWAGGQLSSLVAALGVIDRPGVGAMLVAPVDLPLVSADTVVRLVRAYRSASGALVVRPIKGRRHGHPVLFDRALFDELRRADPALGARAIVRAREAQVLDVPVADEGAFLDIDTPSDYERIIGRSLSDT